MSEKEICELIDKIPTFEGSKSIYNPMETFVKYVSQKEICHSSILADLLNPLGRHALGRSFLDAFLEKIECGSFKDITIRTEMSVPRILTVGCGRRRIDICIINNKNKNVILIENKLNNAKEQDCQLADYKAGLKHKGYNVVKTVCLQGSDFNKIDADVNLSLIDLASLIEKACGDCCELKSYIALLKNMGHKEYIYKEVEKLLSLDKDIVAKVRDLSRPFYEDTVSEYCFNEIESKLKDKSKNSLELSFTINRKYMDIWNGEGFEKGSNFGYCIELWFCDYSRFEIWIKRYKENKLKIEDYVLDERWNDYYRYKDDVKSFPFPDNDEWKTTMIEEIWSLIKELYSDMIKQ